MVFNYRAKKDTGPRTNEQITASEVRVISSTGAQLGIISIREALIHAEDLLKRLTQQVAEFAKVEVPPKGEGKQIMMILVPQVEK